jgi:hypothetical protein
MMMMTRVTKHAALLGLILLTSVAAFHNTATRRTSAQPQPPSLSKNRPLDHEDYPLRQLLFLSVEPPSDKQLEKSDDGINAVVPAEAEASSAYDDGDPRQALEQFGSLFSQVQAIFTEGSTWDSETLEEKTREFVRTYVSVFVPGIGYAATSLAVYVGSFAFVALGLALSGRGYDDVLAAVSGFQPLRELLEKADPSWGNTAIVLLLLEVLSPAILAISLALTPKTMDALRTNLDGWGWGEEGIDDRVAELLGK